MASSRCRVSTPPSPSERPKRRRHIEFGIDTLDLFADDQAVLCQIEKRALLSHVQENPSISDTVISRSCENDNISDGGCQLWIKGIWLLVYKK